MAILLATVGFAQSSEGAHTASPIPPSRLPTVELQAATDMDWFFYFAADRLKAPALCRKIHPMAIGGGGGGEPGYQVWTVQAQCYASLAAAQCDSTLCQYVKPVKTDVWDGSKLDKDWCLSEMRIGRRDHPEPMSDIVSLMHKLGVSDRDVAERLYQNPENNPTYATYKSLLQDQNFINRVGAARSYAGPWVLTRARPTFGLEYLYQMVAVDTDDPSLCGKISPNATSVEPGLRARLLRSNCYVSIAYNYRNSAICSELPHSAASPYVVDRFDSREFCLEYAAILSKRGDEDKSWYAPAPLPHAFDFPAVLEQIGYPRSEAESLVPPPTHEDYQRYFPVIDRATMLKRVMRLK
jgi:hypothetical protein